MNLTRHLSTHWVVTPLPSPTGKTGHMATQRPDTRPPTLPADAYGLKDAAALVARSTKTILRWCRDSTFPNAEKVPGPKGDEWSIPATDLAKVIADKGLAINLSDDDQTVSTQTPAQNQDLVDALNNVANLSGQVGQLSGQNEQLTRQNDRLGSDNDHLRAEYERTQAQLVESERARGNLEGQLEQAKNDVQKAENLRAEVAQERDSLDLEHRELQKLSAESISDLSTKLDSARTKSAETVGERDELAKKLADAEASMGWWTRRRYNR